MNTTIECTKTIEVSIREFHGHENAYEGICVYCGEWNESIEPDADAYTCDFCGEDAVFGPETALAEGFLEIVPDDEETEETDCP